MSEMDSAADSEEATQPGSAGPAPRLAAARLELGFSEKEVADKLRLSPSFIRYIDAGEFDRMPNPAFIKGYLRSYARLVGLSGDEMVALYDAELAVGEPQAETGEAAGEPEGGIVAGGSIFRNGLIGLVALALIAGVVWWLGSDGGKPIVPILLSPLSQDDPPAAERPWDDRGPVEPFGEFGQGREDGLAISGDGDDMDAAVFDDAEGSEDAEGVEDSDDAEGSDDVEGSDGTEGAGAEEAGEEEGIAASPQQTGERQLKTMRVLENGGTHITLDTGGVDEIELTFSDKCWVEISDNQGEVYRDLYYGNDVLTVFATVPLEILLGEAGGVGMTYNGVPFDLAPHTGDDGTATVVLSE